MNNELVKKFIEDKLVILIMYSLNIVALIIFFNLSGPKKIEIFYPITISLFFLIMLISIEFFRYYNFNLSLREIKLDSQNRIASFTNEQKEVELTIKSINSKFMNELNRMKNDYEKRNHFFTQWIHKLKTPISVIDLIIQKCLKETSFDSTAFSDIKLENESLYNSVEQLLTLLRLDKFEGDYEVKVTNIVEVLKKSINEKKNQFIYNKVFPVFNFNERNEAVEYVLTDYKWNEILLSQIISNAIKYSASTSNSKNVYFSLSKIDKNVVLTIKDQGIGIETYDLKRVFEPFFTGENGRKYRNSSGIGLYICKEISEKLGHDIKIYSKPGEGTEVRITYLSKM
ncbi:sensor histidine kinase [Clostridium folliculivorans]|uniref:histidine kinase n=1 Tax=Clostridium folliculivorans TaxID=2886038 RepID=A0A9W5Y248_9CLOT|nr:sensor histidine kinase [Clostridium folliculivorans]GKU25329.1 histidine kinase [Clostridium folliculivorans]GKU28350.1 histidine kinase [Clostridium folliculivorans]